MFRKKKKVEVCKVISAAQARSMRVKDQLTMEIVMEKIAERVIESKYTIFKNSSISKELREELVELGYEIWTTNDSSVGIDWGDDGDV